MGREVVGMAGEVTAQGSVLGFAGKVDARVDSKGRVLLSKRNGENLGKDFVLILKPEGCLAAYPLVKWLVVQAFLDALPYSSTKDAYQEKLYGGLAAENNLDEQGRLVIPSALRKESGLENGAEALVVGANDHVRIWRAEEYRKWDADSVYYRIRERDTMDRLYKALQADHPTVKGWPQ